MFPQISSLLSSFLVLFPPQTTTPHIQKPLQNPLSPSYVLHSHSHEPKMQTSLTLSPFKTPLIFPLQHHPISPKPLPSPPHPQHHTFSLQTQTHVSPVNSLKGPGYLSTIGQAIQEEEEFRKARAQVLRKGVDLEGYTIEGLSIGGHETCVIIPELKSAFDIGRCPSRAIQQSFVFITHAHLDHIVSSFYLLFWVPIIGFYVLGEYPSFILLHLFIIWISGKSVRVFLVSL